MRRDLITHKVVIDGNVLSSGMEKRIGRKVGGTNVIALEYWGLRNRNTKLTK
jgi:hypothetical protein